MDDVRITTRYEADNPLATLFSTLHESGHAMYEQGSNPAYERTPLAGGTSLAVHDRSSVGNVNNSPVKPLRLC